MNELVPIVTGLASGLTVGRAAKSAEEFVAAYFGHKGESIPTMLGDALRRKKENAEQVVGKAYLTLLNIGVLHEGYEGHPVEHRGADHRGRIAGRGRRLAGSLGESPCECRRSARTKHD